MDSNQFDFDKYVEHSELSNPNKAPVKKRRYILDRNDLLFFKVFGTVFFVTLVAFTFLGLTPKEISVSPSERLNNNLSLESQSNTSIFGIDFTKGNNVIHKTSDISSDDLPVRIVIPKAGVDSKIVNPESNNVETLDNELSKAPVRYPGSGNLSEGNIFIFGHSTGFKIVQNQAYKVFNEIKNLKEGDKIIVYSLSGKTYNYSVSKVRETSKYDTWVDFSSKEPSLTLSTCDSFGQASDRYVVAAVKSL